MLATAGRHQRQVHQDRFVVLALTGQIVTGVLQRSVGRAYIDNGGVLKDFTGVLVLSHIPERRDKPAWRRRWKSSTSKG